MADAAVPVGNEAKLRDYLRRVAGDLEEKNRQLGELRARSREPIAIVGMSCRYPGGVDSPAGLWRLVAERTDAAGPFPTDRGWDPEALYHPDPDHPGTSNAREGGFLADAGDFDADFFGISAREAVAMDPQQRFLLEGCWEALEHAGIDPERLRGAEAGVFAGAIQYLYGAGSAVPAELEGYLGTGTTASVLSGRISYALGLTGPAVTVDTACSSSLVALHQAVSALRGGECSLALAGGVTVLSTPGILIEFSRQRVLAPDGRSKAFAAAADGVGWSEGIGVLVLERLADAQAAGHTVLATIRGSAVNQDGASNGMTAPNGPSQERVIRQALANAHLTPAEVDAVEAHGTGTPLGDPIEAGALLATYGADRGDRDPLWLGSIKSNIGHSQAAAGVAGVIKMVEALRHEELPATIHLDSPSPHIDWDSGAVELLSEPREWKRNGRPRRAAVSSFGISGTNAHVIIEEAPAPGADPAAGDEDEGRRAQAPLEGGPLPFILSAKGEPALREAAARLASHLRARPDLDLADLAWSLATSRAAFEHRAVALAEDREELLGALDALAAGVPAAGVVSGRTRGRGKLAFVFPGQGTQWPDMARELLDSSPVFAASIAECEAAFAPYLDWSPLALLRDGEGPDLDRVEVVQPVLFSVMVSLARLWRSFGIEPAAVVGHSQGELAGSCIAGTLPLPDAVRVIALRSQALADQLVGKGGVVSLALSAERTARAIEPFGGRLSLAAVNGPASTVVSGDPEAVEELLAACEADGVRAKRIPIDVAAHSAQTEALKERLDEELAGLSPRAGEIPFFSTVTAGPIDGEELDAGYWFRNLREPVLFEGATRALLADSFNAFIEVSPQPVLTMAVAESVEAGGADPDAVAAFGTLRRDEGGPARFLAALAEAHVNGIEVDWTRLFAEGTRRRVELPTYPFQRERFWLETRGGAGDVAAAGLGATGHPLLGAEVAVAGDGSRLFTGRISTEAHPWLADHAVLGTVILPGTGFLELALHAGARAGLATVEELVLQAPLVLPEGGAVQIQVSLGVADQDGRSPVAIHSRPAAPVDAEEPQPWTLHATGHLTAAATMPEPIADDLWPPAGAEPIGVDGLYDGLADAGFEYGPVFQGLTAAWRRGQEIFADVSLPEDGPAGEGGFEIHPALLDAALHGVAAALLDGGGDQAGVEAGLPFAWSGVSVQAAEASALRVRIAPAAGDGRNAAAAVSVTLESPSGAPLGSVRSLVTRPVSKAAQLGAGHHQSLFRLEWIGLEGPAAAASDPEPLPALGAEEAGEAPPPRLILDTAGLGRGGDLPAAARTALDEALALIQGFLADERLAGSQLVVLTHAAVATRPGEAPVDLAGAPIWGLARSAQGEHPGRLLLVDTDDDPASVAALSVAPGAAAALGERQLALRGGEPLVPRMARAATGGPLAPPADAPAWRLEAAGSGTLEDLALVACEEATAPLAPGEVRVAVHAAGLNLRDVLAALGVESQSGPLGGEGAGVVVEVGPGVEDLAVGDRVMGLIPGSFGPLATAAAGLLAKVPAGRSLSQAASLPTAFLTASHALRDLAALGQGERLLVVGAAGGVGIAALRLAGELGAEAFAIADPQQWEALEALGIDRDHLASSRDAGFRDQFPAGAEGEGMDVVLDLLGGELGAAARGLLAPRGRFLEVDGTDIGAAEPERIAALLAELAARLGRGELEPPPLACFDLRHAADAFRLLREGRHVGKVVLEVPRSIDRDGTVLITGGTGTLGGLLARHLAAEDGVAHLLLISRGGPEAEGAAELRRELEGLGAEVTIAACDVADRDQLAAAIAAIPAAHPLRAVIHAAGALDDGMIEALDPERLAATFAPKAEAAWHLHELTAGIDLDAFVAFSSAAGTVGSPGQGNYAAANVFLDALCARRRAEGLPATSLAWGPWETRGGITKELDDADRERLSRAGIGALSAAEGLALFDAAHTAADALILPIRLDLPQLRAGARLGVVPPLLSGLVGGAGRRAGGGSLARTLADTPEGEREKLVLDLVRAHVAVVVGRSSREAIDPTRTFKDLGFDSLAAVELRNRLVGATGVQLPATLVFDHPTPARAAAFLREQAASSGTAARAPQQRLARTEEPIAIVGMSCRYPGGVSSPREFWRLLDAGADAVGGFPQERGWDLERLRDPDPSRPGATYVTEGAFLSGAGEFDAEFFGIAPREALAMDPQQRLLLEGTWEVLEDAGIDPAALRGSQTGFFAGVVNGNYGLESVRSRGDLEGYVGIGNTASVASGRVAYTFGLEGPAVSVDTACSSSLVAIHLACQALRQGECSLALAGGVAVIAEPGVIVELSRQRALAPDGRCKAFGAGADGMGTAEGMGLVLLEPLSAARRNGHEVLATIRGSAVNQDGASNGMTAPNGPSQERVIMRALAGAGLSAGDIDAVEAHGTGTPLGDPIEAGALLAAYGQERGERGPLRLGSVKSNIGHTQAAAGVAGVIKMVEALRREELPRTLHADSPSEHIDWEAGEVELLREAAPWPRSEGRPRRAGVSSFGISGTNAHLILEEAPEEERVESAEPAAASPSSPLPDRLALPLSARSEDALRQMAAGLAQRLREDPGLDPADVSFSLATGRARLPRRAVVAGADREELLGGLDGLARGEGAAGLVGSTGRPVFVFSGQGSQWPGMARGLLEGSPVFAAAVADCEEAFAPFVDWSLGEVLGDAEGVGLERFDVVQPALFAVMVSLARLWEACGVRPAAVVGHSQGEIAAAHVAGALSLEDAARIVALRSRAIAKMAGRGGMLSLALGAEDARALLTRTGGDVSLAAVNGPDSVVVSGGSEALAEVARACAEEGVRTQGVAVDCAGHSVQVDALREEMLEGFAPVSARPGEVPFYSTVTGGPLDPAGLGAGHWFRNARGTVLFEPAIGALLDRGERRFLEIGPHPVLAPGLEATLAGTEEARVLGTLRRGEGGPRRFLSSLAAAELAGVEVDWAALAPGGSRVELPTYPFRRERFWLVPDGGGDPAAVGQVALDHPFLGAAVELPEEEGLLLTGRVSLADHPWLADHAVLGTVLLPGTALLELALRAGEMVAAPTVRELTLQAPMVLPEDARLALAVRVGPPGEDGSRALTIASRAEEERTGWTVNATGTVDLAGAVAAGEAPAWSAAGAEPIPLDGLYERLAEAGFDYGPEFRLATAAWRRGEEVFVEVEPDPDRGGAAAGFVLHPAVLDAAFHPLIGLPDLGQGGLGAQWLPFCFSGVRRGPGDARSLRARVAPGSKDGEISLAATDEAGATVLVIDSLLTRPVDPAALRAGGVDRALHALAWREVTTEAGEADGAPIKVALLGDPGLELDPDLEVLARHPVPDDSSPEAVHSLVAELLATVQAFLGDEEHEGSRLVVLTRDAFAVGPDEAPDPALAAALGLLGSAASEHPGRIASIDLDAASAQALPGALALGGTEPRLALRDGRVLAPRLTRAEPPTEEPPPPDPDRTVLVTGASGALGGLVARHMAEGGSRHLVLASRRGPEAEGAAELLADLEELGAEARIVACDVADPEAVEALVAGIDPEHRLGTVVHCAGVLEDATAANLDPDRLDRVLAPKVDGAWNLHQATAHLELERLVLFSSLAGVLGGPGQGNYAAANSYLDALAGARRAEGLPATSLAWGNWEAGMMEGLTEAQRERIARSGLAPIAPEEGLAMLDRALASPASFLVAAPTDPAALRRLATAGLLPPLFGDLVRSSRRSAAAPRGDLAVRLATVPEAGREAVVLALVTEHVAAVLGHASGEAVDPDRAFRDLGFDSLAAVELRNRLVAATGLRLAPTLVFDHPTAREAAAHLLVECTVGAAPATDLTLWEAFDKLKAMLDLLAPDDDAVRIAARERLASYLHGIEAPAGEGEGPAVTAERVGSMSADELLDLIDGDGE